MPINSVKDSEGRARLQFEFSRRLGGGRKRIRKLLPLGWSRTQADAFDRKESARLYAQAAGFVEQKVFTIDQAVARYITGRTPELKHGRNTINEIDLLSDYFTGRPLMDLPEVCADYLDDYHGELAPATCKNRLRYLVSACRYAWKHHKMAPSDPGAGVVFPAVNNERQVYIDRREMLQLARACDHWETRALIRIAFYSGMRKGEIMAAEVDDGYFVLPDSKNGDPVRIPVHRKIRPLVDYVWPSRFTTHYWFKKAREAIGRPDLHFHDIRHSTASELLAQGHELFIIGKVLRHKSSASTQRYAHLRDDLLARAIDSIGKKA